MLRSSLLTPLIAALFAASTVRINDAAQVEIVIVEEGTGKPLSCRVHLKDASSKPQRAPGLPFWRDHFVCPGAAQMTLSPGNYTFEIERGPEYSLHAGTFKVQSGGQAKLNGSLKRLVDMAAEGWWSGELHVHRPTADIELLMRAEDLHVAPVITWWNNQNLWLKKEPPANLLVPFDGDRFTHLMAGEDEREGGALLYFGLRRPLAITGSSREFPSPMKFVAEARRHEGVWIDVEKPFWWDVPVWLASRQVDSIGLANNHMCRDQMYENEAWGKPRIVERLPAPLGNGYWSQEIYYHILNCGLRIPPSAGSASGVLPNPVGYNRVYVHAGRDFTYESWWRGLKAGRSFVTNGPLLRVQANGELPGYVFTAPDGQPIEMKLKAALTARERIRRLDVIRNGQVERSVPFEEWSKTGSLGVLKFDSSGWFLVRVIADNSKTFRFASTAPFYVEIGAVKRRISKTSAKFFLDWVRERTARVRVPDAVQRDEVLKHHRFAENFWKDRLAAANAD